MQLRMKTLIFLEFTDKSNFQGGEEFTKKLYIEGGLLERGIWTVYRFKGVLGKKDWGVDNPINTMLCILDGF